VGMGGDAVVSHRVGCALQIDLNRASKGNAITSEMGAEVGKALRKAEEDESVRVVILSGRGKYFCTGMDLNGTNQESLEADIQSGQAANRSFQLFQSVKSCKKLTIALLNGPAYGGGCGLFFACDIRLLQEEAFLCFSEVRRGVVPALISAFVVPQLGEYLCTFFMTTGLKLPLKLLYQRGLVTSLFKDKEEADTALAQLLGEVELCAPDATAWTKRTVQFCASHDAKQNEEFVKDVFSRTIQSDEALHGIASFLNKEQPRWCPARL
jgi:enoyl-CoA hydratase/carnithine racemase